MALEITALHQLATKGCAMGDGHLALDWQGGGMSFATLQDYSDILAGILIKDFAVGPADVVAIIAEKTPFIVVLALSIWKAGAIYAPIDASSATQRAHAIISSLNPRLVISSDKVLARDAAMLEGRRLLSYESAVSLCKTTKHSNALAQPHPDDVAAIIHTSGSTGVPKGVMLSHKSIIHYMNNHNEYYLYDGSTCGMNHGPFHFDISIQDTFLPLAFGSRVVFHNGSFIGQRIVDLMLEKRVTHLVVMSSVLDIISHDEAQVKRLNGSSLKLLMVGGEICSPRLINSWLDAVAGLRAVYAYGPTENNSICMVHEVHSQDRERKDPYPIGKPLSGVSAKLLDEAGEVIDTPFRSGVLAVGGNQLMSGYWQKPDLSAAALKEIDGEVFYITGDHCYFDLAKDYHFVGRKDSEVKIRGHRINLNEVRHALLSLDGIRYAQVGVTEIAAGPQIFAFVYAGGVQMPHAEVLEKLSDHLPPYMMPTYLMASNTLEQTSTGKVNEAKIERELKSLISGSPGQRFL